MLKPFVLYRQADSMDCGAACLKMIAKHFGKSIPLQDLRESAQVGKEGVNLLGISEAAEKFGFRTNAVKISYDSLAREASLPCILHWNQNHFVVLYKIRRYFQYIADPSFGLARFGKEEFITKWISDKNNAEKVEGVALLLEPGPKFFEYDEDRASKNDESFKLAFKNIYNYIFPYKRLLFQLFLGLFVSSILQLAIPFVTQSIVDVGVNTANLQFVYIVLFAQAALTLGRLSVDFVRSWLLLHISTRINISILTDFLVKLMRLPLSFFDTKRTGDILQRMNDHQRIEAFLTGSSINILFSVTNLIIFSLVLVIYNTYMFFVFIIGSVIYSIWVLLFLKRRKVLDYIRFDVASKEQSATIQIVQGMQDIKLNGVEKSMRWNWEYLQAKLLRLSMKILALNQWQQSGAFLINEGKNIFITFLSARAAINGQMTVGAMLAVQYIIGQLNSPIEQMVGFVQSWQNAHISMTRLNEIHMIEDEEPDHKHLLRQLPKSLIKKIAGGDMLLSPELEAINFGDHKGYNDGLSGPYSSNSTLNESAIFLSNVTFAYPGAGNEPVLRDLNMRIPLGRTTAIVGVSGSGKTTLLKLLLKFYEPQKGDIRLGGSSLFTISHRKWREHCGVVMQDSYIFSDTITNNIAISIDRVNIDLVWEAVRVANIGEFIESLPFGLNTKIGPEGMGISMGQKQRILIARAVYRNPDFILFDEATNSLDANNESAIVKNLGAFLYGKTVVIVAHRLSTVKYADQIIVLNKGSISERGTHQELVNLKGEYFTLVKNQLELGE